MVTIRDEKISDIVAREALLDVAYGAERFTKTSERLREGRLPADRLVAGRGRTRPGHRHGAALAGHSRSGTPGAAARPACGPSGASQPRYRFGADAPCHRPRAACSATSVVLLVGDAPYYSRFGFTAAQTGDLWMPGRFERDRLLALELKPQTLAGARGMIGATGKLEPKPELNLLIAATFKQRRAPARRAA